MLAQAGGGLAALLLAACSSPEDIAAKTGVADPANPAAAAAAAAATPAPAKMDFTDSAKEGEAKRDFAYSWPAEVSAVPELTARLTAERDQLLGEQKAEWEASVKDFAGEDCISCTTRDFQKSWEVVANLPRFLSLSASFYAYTGGAHGNGAFDALVWDREAKQAFDPRTMFTSDAGLQQALGTQWCAGLKAERQKRLGPDYSDDGFFPCPPIADLTVLVGSSDRRAFNRIGLIAAAYVAGSYAEGPDELTFPVTPAVLAAVKPEYKAAFAPAK